jgi:hypothetical protein
VIEWEVLGQDGLKIFFNVNLSVKWCRTQVKNPISVFQIKKKSEEFNSEARGGPCSVRFSARPVGPIK